MFEADFGWSHGWRRPKCRLRRSVRPVGRDEGTREAGGLPGEKTFGDFGSFQSHSPQPEGRAKPCRGQSPRVLHGEAMPLRRGTTFSRGMTLAPLTLTLSHKGRGELLLHGEAMPSMRWMAFSRRMTLAPLTLTLSRKGRGDLILHGEAMPLRRGTTFSRRMTLAPLTPNPLPQGERGSERRPPRLKQIAEA